ncbi:MAG: type II toxin-antitoxin system HicB family antitoxin [Dysgonamonadaceae bacterium]|jgi:predicted HicB family RNase H-like nuclease|nr:type II toxin-antitoxin system HicB family antitoxin [Dysgonamonadaceae bacterium]
MERLEYRGYFGSIEYSREDNYFYGCVLGIPKNIAITYEGENATDLIQDFRNGIDSYLEYCKERGVKPHKSYMGVLNIRIPSEIHAKIAMIAENSGTTINAFIRESIERRLEHV